MAHQVGRLLGEGLRDRDVGPLAPGQDGLEAAAQARARAQDGPAARVLDVPGGHGVVRDDGVDDEPAGDVRVGPGQDLRVMLSSNALVILALGISIALVLKTLVQLYAAVGADRPALLRGQLPPGGALGRLPGRPAPGAVEGPPPDHWHRLQARKIP